MSKLVIADASIAIKGYTLSVSGSGRKIVVSANKEKNKEELRAVNRRYRKYKRTHNPGSRPLTGKFVWCANPDCNNAFYACKFRIKKDQKLCCCLSCAARIIWSKNEKLADWFLGLDDDVAARWIVNVVQNRNPSSLKELNDLIVFQGLRVGDRIRRIVRGILCYVVAGKIIRDFCDTREGRSLRDLIFPPRPDSFGISEGDRNVYVDGAAV